MGFGQYTASDNRPRQRDQGYPSLGEARANAKRGYIRKDEQLAHENEEIVWSRKWGKTATKYKTESGRIVYRLYDTNIVEVDPGLSAVTLDTGGWHTNTTRRAMMDALMELFDERFYVWGTKHRGPEHNVIRFPDGTESYFGDRTLLTLDQFGYLHDPSEN